VKNNEKKIIDSAGGFRSDSSHFLLRFTVDSTGSADPTTFTKISTKAFSVTQVARVHLGL
jgi:hypothetical protein